MRTHGIRVLKLSFRTKRWLSFILIPLLIGAWVSELFDLYLFSRFDKQVIATVTLALGFIASRTSQEEFRRHRDQADLRKYGEIKDRGWRKAPLIVLFLALTLFYFLWDEFRYV